MRVTTEGDQHVLLDAFDNVLITDAFDRGVLRNAGTPVSYEDCISRDFKSVHVPPDVFLHIQGIQAANWHRRPNNQSVFSRTYAATLKANKEVPREETAKVHHGTRSDRSQDP